MSKYDQIVSIAKVCHAANKSYCEGIGDTSHKNWEETPTEIQQSAINGVTFRLSNPDVTPEQMHGNWMKDKIAAGWVHGETKDLEKKTHPNLVPYEQLPEAERKKDSLFSAIVGALNG